MSDHMYLLVGLEPGESWPLVPKGEKFNAEIVAWTVYTDGDKARAKRDELNSSDEYDTEWQVIPRRID